MISVVLCKGSQPSRSKIKSYDENFVTAKCACIDDRATLTKSAIVHELQDSYGPEKILKFLMKVMPIGYDGRKL